MRKQVETAWAGHFLSSTRRLQSVLKIELEGESVAPRDGPLPVRTDVYVDMRPLNVVASRARPLILVIDDDRAIRELERQLVTGNGFDCVVMSSAEGAREWMVQNPPPEGIVLDLLMPGLDGMSFLREVRSRGYQGPVVVCSSVSSAVLRTEAEGLSGVVCVEKATELHRIPGLLREGGVVAQPAG
jgi:CheY-like chemotaxis protein